MTHETDLYEEIGEALREDALAPDARDAIVHEALARAASTGEGGEREAQVAAATGSRLRFHMAAAALLLMVGAVFAVVLHHGDRQEAGAVAAGGDEEPPRPPARDPEEVDPKRTPFLGEEADPKRKEYEDLTKEKLREDSDFHELTEYAGRRDALRRLEEEGRRHAAHWMTAIRGAKAWEDPKAQAHALARLVEALGSNEDAVLLGALRTIRWLDDIPYDRETAEARVRAHIESDTPAIRRAAREALVTLRPDPADLGKWLDAALTATKRDAETTAYHLVMLADGKLTGDVADAILYLLRDTGSDIEKSSVMLGLQKIEELDPRIDARLIEIVRKAKAKAQDRDALIYFRSVATRLPKKSDAAVDLILEWAGRALAEEGNAVRRSDVRMILMGLAVGLSAGQKGRAADSLLAWFEDASTPRRERAAVLAALMRVAGWRHLERLEALRSRETTDEAARALLEKALRSAGGIRR